MILHTFGWVIAVETEDNETVNAFPVRVRYRGFNDKSNTEGYIKVSQYMKDKASELLNEVVECRDLWEK